ncbi:MAG: metalloregulator ArsR/SmtB family transcription factor [Marmoricola sp.]
MDDTQLDLVFGALADRTRRAILARLAESDTNVGDLTSLFTMSQPAVSRHLKVLEQAGLVSRNRHGTMRPSHLEAEPLQQATIWLGGYREYWEASHARLDALLASLDG